MKKLYGAAKAAHEKRLAKSKRKRSTTKKGSRKMAKKRKSGGSRKGSRRRRGGAGGAGLSKKDLLIAGATALGYGYLQAQAEEAKGDELKWFKEAPTITPVGRAGTIAIALYAAWKLGRVRMAKPLMYGMVGVAALQFGRRKLKPYEEADKALVMQGSDEMYLEGGSDDVDVGEIDLLDVDGEVIAAA